MLLKFECLMDRSTVQAVLLFCSLFMENVPAVNRESSYMKINEKSHALKGKK